MTKKLCLRMFLVLLHLALVAPPAAEGVALVPERSPKADEQHLDNEGHRAVHGLPGRETPRIEASFSSSFTKLASNLGLSSKLELDSKVFLFQPTTSGGDGDGYTFASAAVFNFIIVFLFLAMFSNLRREYPMVYSYNVLSGNVKHAARVPEDSFFGWLPAAMAISSVEVERIAGLDAGMMVEFINLCCKIMSVMAVPFCCLLAPLHVYEGRWSATGGLESGKWLCVLHGLVTISVVVAVEAVIFDAQRKFLPRRFSWLASLQPPRSTTVLVTGIPAEHRTDKKLHAFFEAILPGRPIRSAIVVKRTETLVALLEQQQRAKRDLQEVERAWATEGRAGKRPTCRTDLGKTIDSIKYHTEVIKVLGERAEAERLRILKDIKDVDDEVLTRVDNDSDRMGCLTEVFSNERPHVYGHCGFVTFQHRADVEVALATTLSADVSEWNLSAPSEPSDMNYTNLCLDSGKEQGRWPLVLASLCGVFFLFLPGIALISGLTNLARLEMVPGVGRFGAFASLPAFQSLMTSIISPLALTAFMSVLPAVLHCIFDGFFLFKSQAAAQANMQKWYFAFLIGLVLVSTCLVRSLLMALPQVLVHPSSAVSLVLMTIPRCSHFYVAYICMQWSSHALDMLRHAQLCKFVVARKMYGTAGEAHKMSEPEDGDYHGIGMRTARLSSEMAIGIVFCTFCPLITVVVLIDLFINRLVYGYLLVFQETKKADLGGVFWVTQLRLLYFSLTVYAGIMTVVLLELMRTEQASLVTRLLPGALAGLAFLYVVYSWHHFGTALKWEKLPVTELLRDKRDINLCKDAQTYEQPELLRTLS